MILSRFWIMWHLLYRDWWNSGGIFEESRLAREGLLRAMSTSAEYLVEEFDSRSRRLRVA